MVYVGTNNKGGFAMKKRTFMKKLMGCVNALALLLVVQTANAACIWVAYQPEFPMEAKKYCKITKND